MPPLCSQIVESCYEESSYFLQAATAKKGAEGGEGDGARKKEVETQQEMLNASLFLFPPFSFLQPPSVAPLPSSSSPLFRRFFRLYFSRLGSLGKRRRRMEFVKIPPKGEGGPQTVHFLSPFSAFSIPCSPSCFSYEI